MYICIYIYMVHPPLTYASAVLPALKPLVSMNLVATIMEIIGETNSFHNFHCFWNRLWPQKVWRLQNKKKREIIGSVTNNFHDF